MRLVGNHPPRNLWGEYKIRTCVKGFADLRMTTLPTRLICSPKRIRTLTKTSVVFRAIRYTKEPIAPPERFELSSAVLETDMLPLHQRDVCWNDKIRTYNLPRIRRMLSPLSYIPILHFLVTMLCSANHIGRNSRIRTCVLHIPNVAR